MSKTYFFLILTYLIANPLDDWVDQNKNVIKEKIKSVSFKIRLESGINSNEYNILNGQIIIGEKRQFRFEMVPRTVVSDGTLWKSYDKRTNQIFIQEPDKKLEKSLFSWVKLKKIKALPVKLEPDGGYRLKLLGKEKDIRAYFNPGSNELESIIIIQSDMRSEVFKIILAIEDVLNLDIGNQNSASFDLR